MLFFTSSRKRSFAAILIIIACVSVVWLLCRHLTGEWIFSFKRRLLKRRCLFRGNSKLRPKREVQIGWLPNRPKFHLARLDSTRHDSTRSTLSSESSCAVRLARHSQNAWLDTSNVSSRVESSQVEFGLYTVEETAAAYLTVATPCMPLGRRSVQVLVIEACDSLLGDNVWQQTAYGIQSSDSSRPSPILRVASAAFRLKLFAQ